MPSSDLDQRPGPGEEHNPGPPVLARQAATVILLRDGSAGQLELLLVKRNPSARFMGGVWVFPGGAVDPGDTASDGDDDSAYRAAAVRELHEEAGVELSDPAALVKFSRWITPAAVRVRFDTHFYLAALPEGAQPKVDGKECVDLDWYTPQGALDAHTAERILLVFPTIKHLEQLTAFASVDELLQYAAGREVLPVQPRVVLEGEVARIVLPGEPGYE